MSDQPSDRFTLPGDIPDAAYWDASTRTAAAARERAREKAPLPPAGGAGGGPVASASDRPSADPSRKREGEERRGYSASHPAGRGWVPLSRDLGIPSEPVFPRRMPDDPFAGLGHSAVFTRELRVRFLDHLSFKGNARAAAALVGVSHETAYRKRRQDATFAELWEAALVHARKYGESQLATRALDGVEVAIVYGGEITGYRIHHDTRLLLAHLGRLDRRVETDAEATARAARFDELLAEYAGHEAPEGFAEAADEARAGRPAAAAPGDLPPTRDEYVAYCRGLALDTVWQAHAGDDATTRGNLSPEARETLAAEETAAMQAAGEAAGAEWDGWHDGALARVGAILEDEAEYEEDGVEEGGVVQGGVEEAWASPLPPAGEDGEGPVAPASDPPAAGPACGHEGEPSGEPPFEVKSAPDPRICAARNRVTAVNPPSARPGARPLQTAGGAGGFSAYSAPVTFDLQGERKTMNVLAKGTFGALGALALAVPAAAQFGGPPPPPNTGVPLHAALTGASGQGAATLVVDPPKGTACYLMNFHGLDSVTAAHIHIGAAGETGRPVLTLDTPDGGTSGGCAEIAAELSAALLANPGGYYVNIHTRAQPTGAIRGQLMK